MSKPEKLKLGKFKKPEIKRRVNIYEAKIQSSSPITNGMTEQIFMLVIAPIGERR